jgi:hypothetical protein
MKRDAAAVHPCSPVPMPPIKIGPRIIRDALGIETEDVPTDREQRARIIGDWIKAEAQFLA